MFVFYGVTRGLELIFILWGCIILYMETTNDKKTSARTKANNKWNSKAYDRLAVFVAKGSRDLIKARAAERGESVNGYINGLIAADIPGYNKLSTNDYMKR